MRTRTSSILAALGLIIVSVCAASVAHADFSGSGDGSTATPFLITTCSQLQELQNQGSGNQFRNYDTVYYRLSNDIDCSGFTFTPILKSGGAGWDGNFDGSFYKINNLTISVAASAGLFQTLDQAAVIANVSILNAAVTGTSNVGILAGEGEGQSISNVAVSGIVSGDSLVGGLIGSSSSSIQIDNCSSSANVTGTGSYIGGLIGQFTPTSDPCVVNPPFHIRNSYATGSVTGNSIIGGFSGGVDAHTTITNCYATGAVTLSGSSSTIAGGFVGNAHAAAFANSFSTGLVTGDTEAGGFVGNIQIDDNSTLPPGDCPYTQASFSNNFYGASSGKTVCAADDSAGVTATAAECQSVDNVTANPSYFFSNSSNAPLNSWDFSSIWATASNSTPVLQSNTEVPTPTPTVTATPTMTGTATATPTPTLTPTETATPTASSTPTVTAAPTITETPQPTPTGTINSTSTVAPTVTPTETATSTPAVLETATPTATATATATSTFAPTNTEVPLPIATSTVTSTPTPVPSTILSGNVKSSAGNAVVYLYANGIGIGSTTADKFGNFSFTGTPGTIYQAIPHLTGVTFSPATLNLTTGTPGVSEASDLSAASLKCSSTGEATRVTATDASVKSLYNFVAATGSYVVTHVSAKNVVAVTKKVNAIVTASNKKFTAVLNKSLALPTQILSCSSKVKNCSAVSYESKIEAYQSAVSALEQQVLSLDIILTQNSTNGSRAAATNDQKARVLRSNVLTKLSKIPRSGKQCR